MESRRLDPAWIILGVMLVLVVALVVIVLYQFRRDEVRVIIDNKKEVPVLLVVEDQGRIVLSHLLIVNPSTSRAALLEIPGTLGAIIGTLQRVDSFESLYREKGISAYISNLEVLLDYKIPMYLRVPLEKVESIVDFLGGLSLFVADSIDVSLENGDAIRVPNGMVQLDGSKIRDFLRYEDSSEREQEVSNRRWNFTKALMQTLGVLGERAGKAPYRNFITRYLSGNLDSDALVTWISLLGKIPYDTMLNQRILGTVRTVDTEQGSKDLLFPHFDGKLVKDSLRQMISNLSLADDAANGGVIRLEILNGTDMPGLARKAKDIFVNYGFEVIRFGNAVSTTTAVTQVLDRRGDISLAERTAKIIRATNVGSQMIAQGDDPATAIDVTVILGKDFDGWYVRQSE